MIWRGLLVQGTIRDEERREGRRVASGKFLEFGDCPACGGIKCYVGDLLAVRTWLQ